MRLQILKIVGATGLAVALAHYLGLDNASSAGIIAMLSVLDTRKSSLRIAWQRLMSTVVALVLGVLSFSVLGFQLSAFLLYLTAFVAFAYRFDFKPAIAPCSVLVTHLWLSRDLSLPFLGNEALLMMLGTGMAILLHTYMPSRQESIIAARSNIESQLKEQLLLLSALLRQEQEVTRNRLEDLEALIAESKKTVYQERDNQLFSQTDYDLHYLDMRQDQVQLLNIMSHNLESCHLATIEAKLLASLFELTADQLSESNPATYLLQDIEAMLKQFRERDLPKTREEFETRAILFQLLTDLTRFIQLKIDFYQEYQRKRERFA